MTSKKQVLIIRGGETFKKREDYLEYLRTVKLDPYKNKKSWRDWISWALTETHDVITPVFPCKNNADFESWKIWLERHFEFIYDENPIVIGHSLGTAFILKYLLENKFPKKIKQLHIVAAYVTDDTSQKIFLENINTFAFDLNKIHEIENLCNEIHIWHSTDDAVLSFENASILKSKLPNAKLHAFNNRKHFDQPAFLELLQNIQEVK
jgi:predicted alpha/beta hydrolase family esterase